MEHMFAFNVENHFVKFKALEANCADTIFVGWLFLGFVLGLSKEKLTDFDLRNLFYLVKLIPSLFIFDRKPYDVYWKLQTILEGGDLIHCLSDLI